MSEAGAVLEGLKALIQDRLADRRPPTTVSVGPPASDGGAGNLNLFVFDITDHSAAARRTGVPRELTFDMHVLLTGTGDGTGTSALDVLTAGAAALVGDPQLTGSSPVSSSDASDVLTGPQVGRQAEAIRIRRLQQTFDDSTKLWTALSQPYRPGFAFKIGPIRKRVTSRLISGPPVGSRQVTAVPARPLTVRLISLSPPVVGPGDDITVETTEPVGDYVLRLGAGLDLPLVERGGEQIATVPDEAVLATARITCGVAPAFLARGDEGSNVIPIGIRPSIVSVEPPADAVGVIKVGRGHTMTLRFSPSAPMGATIVIFAGDVGLPARLGADGRSVSIDVPNEAILPDGSGPRRLRLRIDGVERHDREELFLEVDQ